MMLRTSLLGLRHSSRCLSSVLSQTTRCLSEYASTAPTIQSSSTSSPGTVTSSLANDLKRARTSSGPEGRGTYVRITGCSYYADRNDIKLFLKNYGIDITGVDDAEPTRRLVKVEVDELGNISTWIFKAASKSEAVNVAKKLQGKVCGLKVVRAYTVSHPMPTREARVCLNSALNPTREYNDRDNKLMVPYTTGNVFFRTFSRLRPDVSEYNRSILVRNLSVSVSATNVWYAFSSYNLVRASFMPGLHSVRISTLIS